MSFQVSPCAQQERIEKFAPQKSHGTQGGWGSGATILLVVVVVELEVFVFPLPPLGWRR
jgi:hypothetical protein